MPGDVAQIDAAPPVSGGETAAAHLMTVVPRAERPERVAAVLARLPGTHYDAVETLYVVGPDGRLLGWLGLERLLAAPAERSVGELMQRPVPVARPTDDQERVASLAVQHGLSALPVVDDDGRLLGVVPATTIMAVLRREHIEDLHRLAGIQREDEQARQALEAPPTRRAGHRLPWLLVGLLGSSLATLVMARFEAILEARVAVTFFVPGIVYLADAIGTQTEAIAVRGLSLSNAPLRRVLRGELSTGLLIGLVLGGLVLPLVWLMAGDGRLALAVAVAVVVAGSVATAVGLLLPWLLARAGRDPAYGSGPVATIIQDVASLLIYLLIAQLLLTTV